MLKHPLCFGVSLNFKDALIEGKMVEGVLCEHFYLVSVQVSSVGTKDIK